MSNNILYPTTETFQDLISSNSLVLVDFWATWCTPCKMLAPIIEQLADKYADKVKVVKVDIDEHGQIAEKYGIQSIPTVILFKDGEIVSREVGTKPLNNYSSMIDSTL